MKKKFTNPVKRVKINRLSDSVLQQKIKEASSQKDSRYYRALMAESLKRFGK